MSLYEQWEELINKPRTKQESDSYWLNFFEKEKNGYQLILKEKDTVKEGKLSDLAAEFDMDNVEFTGFLDGINTSLVEQFELESLTEDTNIKLELDHEKLYFNMLDAKADWLYGLEEWDDILTQERRNEITKEYRKSKIAVSNKVGRNDPCPCGSGKKFKKCCGA